MANNTRLFLIVGVLACSCGGDAAPDKRTLCDALAITAGALKDESLKHASDEYAAADRAMQKWEQWNAKSVTAEQNGTGEYSGAGNRAPTYARAGNAFCDAANVQMWQLTELATLTNDRDVKDAAYRLFRENLFCSWHDLGTAKERNVFLGDWERRRSELEATARDVVDACFKKFGGTAPSVHTPGIWVPVE